MVRSICKGLSSLFANIDDNKETAQTSNPDTFDGSNPKALNTFFTACATTFIGRPKAYRKPCSRVTYALSFLRGPARDHFAPLISEADDTRIVPPMFEDWPLFKAELTWNFGPTNPIADTESAINKLSLTEDGKAIKYFVEFNKYKSRTRFNDRGYYVLVMNQMPMRILCHIAECIPLPPDYETLQAFILSIDAQYWNFKEMESSRKKA